MSLRLPAVFAAVVPALFGCGGAVQAAATGDDLRAHWIDERTVVLPRSAIQFDHRYALRVQASRELGCPLSQVTLADPVRVGDHDVVPVRACGAETYYARVETGSGTAFLSVGGDPLLGTSPTASAPTPSTPDSESPTPSDPAFPSAAPADATSTETSTEAPSANPAPIIE